jgi:hypothetical protein
LPFLRGSGLDAPEAIDPLSKLKRAKRFAAHTTFTKLCIDAGRLFLCIVKTRLASSLLSAVEIFEPIDQ